MARPGDHGSRTGPLHSCLQPDPWVRIVFPGLILRHTLLHSSQVVEEEEDFLDEEGETPVEGEAEGEGGDKPAEGGDASKEQDTGSE